MDKHGNREHCPSVEVSLETCYHHIFIAISNLFRHCILLTHGLTFGNIMCVFGFLCFNGICGFCVYSFLVDCMFQFYVFVMFQYKVYVFVLGHVSNRGYVFLSRPCFSIHVFVSSVCFCIESIFQIKGMFQFIISCLGFILCF